MAAIIPKIRAGNQFEYLWAIERAGVAVDLTTATDIELSYGVGKPCTDYSTIPFTVVDTNKISSSHLYGVTGTYNLKLEFKIDGEQSTIDIDAFKIVPRSEDASDSTQFAVTSDMAIGFKGDKLTFADLTPSDIAELQQPANDAIASIQAVEGAISDNENNRVDAEYDRNQEEINRQLQEVARQTNTGTAIHNAQTATTNANNATTNANNAATLANTKAGLADTAATNADNARLAIQTDLALKEATANKQNNLAADGTGTKFPTVDAVNGNFATQVEAEANTENTKFMTALRVFQNFVKNATTYAFTTLNTTSKTIIGAINELFANKADKAQEAWITPTLLNGFTGNVSYMKDNFGFVHIRGEVNNTAGTAPLNIFNLPLGYRPNIQVSRFATVGGAFRNSVVYLAITVPGDVQVNVGTTIGNTSLDCVTFKV